jgi:phosphatidylcholine synthase
MIAPGGRRVIAWGVHLFTAAGVVCAFMAAIGISVPEPDPRRIFLWLLLAVLIDATDGPLARRAEVARWVPGISGRQIDDIVDYLTFTFLPLLLVWRMEWVAGPGALWISVAMVASLLGFANKKAKEEDTGFFRGFPSYWNVFALYAGILERWFGPVPGTLLLIALAGMTVMPIRFLYPNLAPRPWRRSLLLGAGAWALLLVAMLPFYPVVPVWLVGLSLVYPAFYMALSLRLSRRGV